MAGRDYLRRDHFNWSLADCRTWKWNICYNSRKIQIVNPIFQLQIPKHPWIKANPFTAKPFEVKTLSLTRNKQRTLKGDPCAMTYFSGGPKLFTDLGLDLLQITTITCYLVTAQGYLGLVLRTSGDIKNERQIRGKSLNVLACATVCSPRGMSSLLTATLWTRLAGSDSMTTPPSTTSSTINMVTSRLSYRCRFSTLFRRT